MGRKGEMGRMGRKGWTGRMGRRGKASVFSPSRPSCLSCLMLALVCLSGCNRQPSQPATTMPAPQDFEKLTDDFTKSVLALSPVSAIQAGYHDHNGMVLDELIDDFSPAGMDAQRRFYRDTQKQLDALPTASLNRQEQADLAILRNTIGGSLLELDTIQSYRHNPTLYVELVGNALYTPFVLNYAPVDTRFRHIIKRLERIPALVDQAKANLVDAPEVWNRVAREENQGNIDLIDHT